MTARDLWTVSHCERADVVSWAELPEADRKWFDYVTDESEQWSARFARFEDSWHDLNEFSVIVKAGERTGPFFTGLAVDEDDPLRHWDAIATDSYFSAVVICNWDTDENTVDIGRAVTISTDSQHFNAFAHIFNATGEFSTGSVCVDCLMGVANGDWPNVDDADNPDWTADSDRNATQTLTDYEVMLGHVHTAGPWRDAADCYHAPDECDSDCDCETEDFSDSTCFVCETTMAGERHAVTAIARETLRRYGRDS